MKRPLMSSLLLLTALLLSSCGQPGDQAIFFFLENEQKIIDYSLPNKATIAGMGRINNFYFASLALSIWRKDATDPTADWVKLGNEPPGVTTAFVAFGANDLYAGTDNGLYRADASASADPTWVQVSDANLNGRQISGLFAVGGRLFAVALDLGPGNYTLYSSATGAGGSFTLELAAGTAEITQVAYDGADYYTAAGQGLYGGAFGAMTARATPALQSGETLGGVYYATTPTPNRLYVSTSQGRVYADAGPTPLSFTWGEVSEQKKAGDKNSVVKFLKLAEVGGDVLVGTTEYGFYEMNDGRPSILTRLPDFNASELYGGWVTGFHVDGTSVFALTGGSGLWRATFSGGQWSDWIHE